MAWIFSTHKRKTSTNTDITMTANRKEKETKKICLVARNDLSQKMCLQEIR